MQNIQWNAVILGILSALFFVFAVKSQSAWAQAMAYASFSSMCMAMQIKTPTGLPLSLPMLRSTTLLKEETEKKDDSHT